MTTVHVDCVTNPLSSFPFERLTLEEHVFMIALGTGDGTPDDGGLADTIVEKLEASNLYHAVCNYEKQRRQRERHVNRRMHKIQLMASQGFACPYCGRDFLTDALTFASATFDHIRPKGCGGRNGIQNLVLACGVCNSIKANAKVETVAEGQGVISKKIEEIGAWLEEARRLRDGASQSAGGNSTTGGVSP